jgi:DNA-binding MarR family transcriptional regulator
MADKRTGGRTLAIVGGNAEFEGGEPSILELARRAQQTRAMVSRLFPRDIFWDSAWDMVLELVIANEENRSVCVKQLICASGETSTSALRRIDRLEQDGIVVRRHDADDHRRVSIALSLKGEEAMAAMLRSLIVDRARPIQGARLEHRPDDGSLRRARSR